MGEPGRTALCCPQRGKTSVKRSIQQGEERCWSRLPSNPGSAPRPEKRLSTTSSSLPQFPSESPLPEDVCLCNPQSRPGRGVESCASHPDALLGGEPWSPLPDPHPPTCKHHGAVGIADVGVRGAHVLGVEDEDPQHGWRDVGPHAPGARRRLGKVVGGPGTAFGSPRWRGLAEGDRLGALAPSPELLLLKRNGPALGGPRGLPAILSPAALTPLVSARSENRGFCSSSTSAALPSLG